MIRRVVFFTGDRSEFWLQEPVIRSASESKSLEVKILVAGKHLDQLVSPPAPIAANIDIDIENSSIPTRMSHLISQVASKLELLKPHFFVVYGDRYEAFSAAIASTQMGIPTAHIEGGDVTEGGTFDESIRHAITKLSHLHFTTNEDSAKRVQSLGEENWRVINVGLPVVDLIQSGNFAGKEEIHKILQIDVEQPIIIVTQHPNAIDAENSGIEFKSISRALCSFLEQGAQVIITYPNSDIGRSAIVSAIKDMEKIGHKNLFVFESLGRFNYHGLLALAREKNSRVVCVGNSSSGIKESPAFGCPTVNIGPRQNGRLRGENVLDVPHFDSNDIYMAIKKALYDESFRESCRNGHNPYFRGGAANEIVKVLTTVNLDKKLLLKKMINTF